MKSMVIFTYSDYVIRLLLAVICGGIIGYERESNTRPAGLRTHILVCAASALIMITSEHSFLKYSSFVNLDPMRMGAQIVSGIGFLGAGTIIKNGPNIKGLTTAACLWAVACVGIAIGTGFYFGAIFTTVIIFLVLIFLRRVEQYITSNMVFHHLYVEAENNDNVSESITETLYEYRAKIRRTYDIKVGETVYITYYFLLSEAIPKTAITKAIEKIEGVISVSYTSAI